MVFFMAFMMILSLVMVARMKVKQESAKPAGLEDFNFPTAEERPIQVLVGTRRLSGPNVLWYGDIKTSAIKQKVKQMFGSKKVVVGYRYYMGLQLGICHGPDVILREIKLGDDVAWSGSSTGDAISINKPSLFGGDEDGNGGFSGTVRFHGGGFLQGVNGYLARVLGANVVSPARGLAYAVFEQCYIGNSSSPSTVSFVASRFPKSPKVNGEYERYERIGDDANPSYFLYEILSDDRFGADISYTSIDIPSFLAAAKTFSEEGLGVSLVIDSSTDASSVVDNILQVIQGALNTDPETGALKLRLIRNDYVIDDLPEIGPHNIKELSEFYRPSLDSAVNEIKLKFLSIADDFSEKTVVAQNNGLRMHKGDTDSKTLSMPMISVRSVAAKIASREMSAISVPLATAEIICNRSMAYAEVGDVVRLSWPPQDIDRLVMRITSVDLGAPGDSAVRISAIQDVFGVFASVYADGSEHQWIKPSFEPVDVTRFDIVDAPAILTGTATRAILVAAEKPSVALDYRLYTDGPADSTYVDAGIQAFTPFLATNAGMAADQYTLATLALNGNGSGSDLDSYTAEEVRQGLGLLLVTSAAGKEWMSYQTASERTADTATLTTINRGLFNTRPLAHPAGARVWAVSEGKGLTAWDFAKGANVNLKMLVMTPTRRQELAEAATQAYTILGTNDAPWSPGNVRVNGVTGGVISGEAVLTWRKRDGAVPAVVFYGDDVSQATDAMYDITVKSRGVQVAQVSGVTGESWTFAGEQALNGGTYYNQLSFEIVAEKAGHASSSPISVSITR